MYSKVEEYKNILKSDEQQYDAYIILEDGTKVDTDISGFRPIYNLGEKIIGNFTTKKIEFTLFNTSKYNITNKEIEAFVGLKINDEFNYISLGKFITDKPVIKDEAQDECKISATNYSLKFKVPYTPILAFPCTINKAIKDICEHLNIEYVENDFINKDYVLQEFFIEEDATFFDVIKILVEAGFANAIITNTNVLIVKSPSMTVDYVLSLNELFDLKKEDNVLGPVNSIVASRIVADDGSTTEDVYKKDEDSINVNGLYEYKIIQNEAIDYDRQTAVNNMLAGILNFEYNPAKIEAVYNPAIEIGDMLEVPDKKTATSFLLLVKEITADLSSGLMTIESTEKTQTETDYKSATAKDKRRNTEIKVNKMEGKITLLAEEQGEQNEKVSRLELDVDTIKGEISNIADITTTAEGYGMLKFENVNESEPIAIRVHPTTEDITPLYPSDDLYPSNDLYPHNREMYFIPENTENDIIKYNIPKNLYCLNGVYDEFVLDYENQECYIIHRIALNSSGEKYKLETTTTEYFDYPSIQLKDGNYKITLDVFKNAYIYAKLMSKNIYTTQFATKVELNSEIKQTSKEIMQEVAKKVNEEEFSTKLSLDYESVNIAWNKISDFIKFIAGQLQIKNNSQKILMALDKTGQHFYDTLENLIGDIGVKDRAISFYINGDKTGNSMEWGIKKTVDNVLKYFPVFKYGEYNVSSGTEFGGNFFFEAPVIFNENKIIFGALQTSPKLYGTETGQVFFEKTNCIQIDSNTGTILKIDENNNTMSFLGVLNYGMNNEGGFSWDFNNDYLTNMGNVPTSTDIDYFNGNATSPASLFVSLKNGSTFTLYSNSSDINLKKNIKACNSNALKKIMKIQHKEFDWKNSNKHENIGFIAQEIEEISSNLVNVHEFKNKDGKIEKEYQINVVSMLAMATKAIQEQQLQIKENKQRIQYLEQEIENLKGGK